jgi:hypothetical protein
MWTFRKILKFKNGVFVFNETHLQKIFFPKLKNYEIKLKKDRTSEQCPEFVKKNIQKGLYYGAKLF